MKFILWIVVVFVVILAFNLPTVTVEGETITTEFPLYGLITVVSVIGAGVFINRKL